jgi:high-affinity iron transporter
MLQSFVITLREGLEAFLIVAISLAYLRRTGRPALAAAVHWGIGISVAVSIAAGMALQQVRNQALWEGVLAIAAAALVGTLIVHMWCTGRRMRAEIEGKLEASAVRTGRAAFLGVLGFTILMITREGMVTVLLMNQLFLYATNQMIILGAAAGILAAAAVAWAWTKYGRRVNLARFFQVTAVFLFVFVVQLVVYGFHELTEANIGIPNSEFLHWATEPYGPDGMYGQYLTYLLVALPLGWLIFANLFSSRRPQASAAR